MGLGQITLFQPRSNYLYLFTSHLKNKFKRDMIDLGNFHSRSILSYLTFLFFIF